ncbi:MAG: hypothetical protein KDA60_11025, partial [Planctomycetales bacterium]|nr:hypothetical protein [Planctomycetales bacterium]
ILTATLLVGAVIFLVSRLSARRNYAAVIAIVTASLAFGFAQPAPFLLVIQSMSVAIAAILGYRIASWTVRAIRLGGTQIPWPFYGEPITTRRRDPVFESAGSNASTMPFAEPVNDLDPIDSSHS